MTKAVLEAEGEDAAEQTAAAVPASALAVPASLHASFLARLDRLGPGKEVAQVGAAIGREFSHTLLAAAIAKPEADLRSALDRLISAGLLFRQGLAPHASYLFKHALVQDAAYGTLLRESRRALHARIVETIERDFSEVAENQPELLARHCTEAGALGKAASLWGRAGHRSLERSALIEAAQQLSLAVHQIANLPSTPALRREQIRFQVALVNAQMHTNGYAATATKKSLNQARLLMEQAEELGEPLDDPLLLFSVLFGFWVANFNHFHRDVVCGLAVEFLGLAEKQKAIGPMIVAHRLVGSSLLLSGDITKARSHFDQAIALYDPMTHRLLATRFGQDLRVATLCSRSSALWHLGYLESARHDTERALKDAREIGQAATLMFALFYASGNYLHFRDYAPVNSLIDELLLLAEEKSAALWKLLGSCARGALFAVTGRGSNAVQMLEKGIAALEANHTTLGRACSINFRGDAIFNHDGQSRASKRSRGFGLALIDANGGTA